MIFQIQFFNKNYYENIASESGWSWSDSLAFIAIAISAFSILFTYYTIYISKKLDIKYNTFEKLIIENITHVLSPIECLFLNGDKKDEVVNSHLQLITNVSSDIDLLLICLKDTYSKLQIAQIIKNKENFFDDIYSNSGDTVNLFKVKYLSFKIAIFNELYKHAIKKEFSLIFPLKQILKNYKLSFKKGLFPSKRNK